MSGNGLAIQGHALGIAGAQLRPAEGREVDASIVERVIAMGDIGKLQPEERVAYYVAVCRSVGLNPLTRPFDYIQLNGKLTLYALKSCTDQLRQIHGVSVATPRRETIDGVHIVTAQARTRDGRSDEDIGAVTINGLKGESLANAFMKATTKAKRRVTLSVCGLSFPDESEVETIPDARRVVVTEDGEILDHPAPKHLPPKPAAPPSQVDEDVYAKLCQLVMGSKCAADLNRAAVVAAKRHKAGVISDDHLTRLKDAVTKMREFLGQAPPKPAPPPSAPDLDDSAEAEGDVHAAQYDGEG